MFFIIIIIIINAVVPVVYERVFAVLP